MNIDTFNKLRMSQQAKIFDLEINRVGANKRTSPISIGNVCAYFVYIDKTALVRIDSDDSDIYFAVEAEKAETYLEESITRNKDIADERDWQFGDVELSYAFIAAAYKLKTR